VQASQEDCLPIDLRPRDDPVVLYAHRGRVIGVRDLLRHRAVLAMYEAAG
jgi:hypothetical protein